MPVWSIILLIALQWVFILLCFSYVISSLSSRMLELENRWFDFLDLLSYKLKEVKKTDETFDKVTEVDISEGLDPGDV